MRRTASLGRAVSAVLLVALSTLSSGFVQAATEAAARVASPSSLETHIELGRNQLAVNNLRGLETLRMAAQQAVVELRAAAAGPFANTINDGSKITELRAKRTLAAQAHFLWGRAEDRLGGDRDRSITALARALEFASAEKAEVRSAPDQLVVSDATQCLSGLLRDGMPLVAPDDVLDTIASRLHGGLWQARRFAFQVPISSPRSNRDNATESRRPGRDILDATGRSRELLITSGKVFPPQLRAAGGSTQLWRAPPLYTSVQPGALPAALRMDRVVLGYAREVDGPNAGLWRQAVRVYHASPYLTRGNRDDRPRAETLCAQLLRAAIVMRAQFGVANSYALDGVTTLWLSEVSAWWPAEDDEPGIAGLLPILRPWRAGAWLESAPDEIMLFKMTQPRNEGEWLREVIHEYSHIALPPFAGFQPPLEPFGNGALGECLGMLWAASAPADFAPLPAVVSDEATLLSTKEDVSPPSESSSLRAEIMQHVERNAATSLQLFVQRGPNSSLRRDGTREGLLYLQGLAVYLERVYGAHVLQKTLAPLVFAGKPKAMHDTVLAGAGSKPQMSCEFLLSNVSAALRDPFKSGEKRNPIWLGGALVKPKPLGAQPLVSRAALQIQAGERLTGWIYVPSGAKSLHVTGRAVAQLKLNTSWKTGAQSSGDALVLTTSGRSGWQHLACLAPREATIEHSWFER